MDWQLPSLDLYGPVLLDDYSEAFYAAHQQWTGCRRPRNFAWLCIALHMTTFAGKTRFQFQVGAPLPITLQHQLRGLRGANPGAGPNELTESLDGRWNSYLATAAAKLDVLMQFRGCGPHNWSSNGTDVRTGTAPGNENRPVIMGNMQGTAAEMSGLPTGPSPLPLRYSINAETQKQSTGGP